MMEHNKPRRAEPHAAKPNPHDPAMKNEAPWEKDPVAYKRVLKKTYEQSKPHPANPGSEPIKDIYGNTFDKSKWDELDHILSLRHYRRKAEVKTLLESLITQREAQAYEKGYNIQLRKDNAFIKHIQAEYYERGYKQGQKATNRYKEML